MGHRSIETTRAFYVPAVLSRLKAASELLGARGLADLAVPASGAMNQPETGGQTRGTLRKSEKSPAGTRDGTSRQQRRKTA
jgi:hypothetical protein